MEYGYAYDVALIVIAAAWGAGAGALVPRAAYRLSVEPDEAWRHACPAGHPITGPACGWLGAARCASCTVSAPAATAAAGQPAAGQASGAPDSGGPDPVGPDPLGPASAGEAPAGAAVQDPAEGMAPVPYRPSLLVPAVTGLVCAALAAAAGPRPEAAVWVLLAPVAVLLALVDRNVHRLPDQLTLPLAAAAAVLLGGAALVPGAAGSWPAALLGGLALGGAYFVLFLINPNGMGFGDVKLAVPLGVVLGWYGWGVLFAGAFAGFLLGAAYGLGLVLLRRAGRKSAIPFGPFMISGALLGLLLGALAA
ncbi:A24 family peptidase [Streptomyces sp. FIT100]|uniref:prepilin peptidase n=1 Tax=Streptomyces sp. FIT100 TaxID=2837956 RepID=UPI0021C70C5A|nr:A24 family peptidase [Streptomyces sp. FIT100]